MTRCRAADARSEIKGKESCDPNMLSPEETDVYARAYRQPGAIRGAAMDYRAAAEDVKQDVAEGDSA